MPALTERERRALPRTYHRLRPFRPLFEGGLPILCYHKLGPRPRGVRLGGLYVSERLFARQLAELEAAGFVTPSLDSACDSPSPARAILLTFDDGFRNVLRYGLPLLARHRFRAVQFIVADLIGKSNEWEQAQGEVPEPLMDHAEIREWLAAGHEIGSHSCTHPHLSRIPLPQAREEITASKKKLEDLFGRPVEHFCYPYGDRNDAVVDLVREAGYRTACTMDFGVNTVATSPLALRRILARHPSLRPSLWISRVIGRTWSTREFLRRLRRG
jgi:peptidoglycan/xylan/chitin deacetylase (PgdA/CDA1 family)